MGSRLIGSFRLWVQFFLGIQGLFVLSNAMCVSVNGIIRLIESVCLGPKVIPLSGARCISTMRLFNLINIRSVNILESQTSNSSKRFWF